MKRRSRRGTGASRGAAGRACKRPTNRTLGRHGFELDAPYRHVLGEQLFEFTRSNSELHGIGLFALQEIAAGTTLGYFTGSPLPAAEGRARRKAGRKCVFDFEADEGGRAWFDGSRGATTPFVWLNSSRGSGFLTNVRFVESDAGAHFYVVTIAAVADGDELLADYLV